MRTVAAVVVLAVVAAGCGGPCKKIATERMALLSRSDRAAGAHARIQVPFAVANPLIAELVRDEPEVPLPLDKLGPLAAYIPKVRAVVRGVEIGPAPPGKVGFAVRVSVLDDTGELLALRGRGNAAPSLENGELAIGIRADQLTRLEPELGQRATASLGAALAKRLPEAVRDRVPQFVIDRVAKAVAEEAADRAYQLLRGAALVRLGELTTLRFKLPPAPIARVDVTSLDGQVPALDLAIVTELPVRTALAVAPPPEPDAVTVAIAGSAAVELANWSVAHGRAPTRYTRSLEPARDGTYVPHFDWRADDAEHPLVIHMFKVEDGCAHFAVGVQPHVEVRDGKLRAWVENRRLEAADATLAFATLARVKSTFDASTSDTKQIANVGHVTLGSREVTTRLLRAEVAGNDIRVSVAVELGARAPGDEPRPDDRRSDRRRSDDRRSADHHSADHHSDHAPGARSQTLVAGRAVNAGPNACMWVASE